MLKTLSGNVSDNRIEDSWDLKDDEGNRIVNNGLRCDFYLNSTSQGFSPNSLLGPISIIYRLFDHIFGRQNFAVAWGFSDYGAQNSPAGVAMNNNMLYSVVDNLNTLFDLYGDGTDYTLKPDGSGNGNIPYALAFRWISDSDKPTLLGALQNSANFFWWGHSWPEGAILPGGGGQIYASDLESAFQQTASHKKHVFRLVILDSCESFSEPLINAFGFTLSPTGIRIPKANYQNLQREPQTFVGWEKVIYSPSSAATISWIGQAQNVLFSEWQSGVPIETCIRDYVSKLKENPFFTQIYPPDTKPPYDEWKISGCYDLQTTDR